IIGFPMNWLQRRLPETSTSILTQFHLSCRLPISLNCSKLTPMKRLSMPSVWPMMPVWVTALIPTDQIPTHHVWARYTQGQQVLRFSPVSLTDLFNGALLKQARVTLWMSVTHSVRLLV